MRNRTLTAAMASLFLASASVQATEPQIHFLARAVDHDQHLSSPATVAENQPYDRLMQLARRIRLIGFSRILYGSDSARGGRTTPRQQWGMFQGMVPHSEAEIAAIARNAAPYAKLSSNEVQTEMKQFAKQYTAAWCSQDPARVAAFFAESGSLTINGGTPYVGRAGLTEAARSFMTGYPDMVVEMEGLDHVGDQYRFRWRFTGTHTGPGGTGRKVRISGYEEWTIGSDGLISKSLGHYDQTDWDRQLGKAEPPNP